MALIARSIPWPKVTEVEAFFGTITEEQRNAYACHWSALAPEDYLEVFDRFLFAFCSVHTGWQANVRGYEAIKPWFGWQQDSEELKRRLVDSRIGLHINRTRYIGEFCAKFWVNPSSYYKTETETWVQYRDRLVKDILGLGLAKVSFALELMYPTTAQVVCLDTHMFQFYGLDQTKNTNQYHALERHWIGHCQTLEIPSTIARAICWDRKQNKQDSSYWTHVFQRKTEQIPIMHE